MARPNGPRDGIPRTRCRGSEGPKLRQLCLPPWRGLLGASVPEGEEAGGPPAPQKFLFPGGVGGVWAPPVLRVQRELGRENTSLACGL